MSKEEKERLNHLLINNLNTILEKLQVLNQSPPSSLNKVSWDDVVKLGEHLYKQATTVGMLWTGEGPDAKALEETMASYFNLLQEFLLLSHGSIIGAGTTLCSYIRASVKQVTVCSSMLLKESVPSYGNISKAQKLLIPQTVSSVWDACSALKKSPATNVTAIGQAMTQIAVSVKDVLDEMMKELKLTSNEVSEPDEYDNTHESDNSADEDSGSDLSPEEMKVAELAINVVSETLSTIKEVIRSIPAQTGNESDETVNLLEKLSVICRSMGLQVDEIGACRYSPQEVSAIRGAAEKMMSFVGEMQVEMEKIKGSSEAFVHVSNGLMSCLRELELGLGSGYSSGDELANEMESLVVGSRDLCGSKPDPDGPGPTIRDTRI